MRQASAVSKQFWPIPKVPWGIQQPDIIKYVTVLLSALSKRNSTSNQSINPPQPPLTRLPPPIPSPTLQTHKILSDRNDSPLKSGRNDPPLKLGGNYPPQLGRNDSPWNSGRNDPGETIWPNRNRTETTRIPWYPSLSCMYPEWSNRIKLYWN